ncbi:Tetratricopeptide repeat-containing protein [Mariprofundus aestuarium]|uniref:Tetratricopeptide repeat-containing protein n=1 Tax=Mariprofundus aestuarium TaxID=1921086 RepID=A0A2K8L942_MARES|nr:sulfotransferase [Mariprofundus aestuarium]ATX80786.1 Tetratricopeptide repeat-containing protein [Mariprofundus aestuarium]
MAAMKISNNKKRKLITLTSQAIDLAKKGKLEMALRICDRADREHKNFPDIMYARGLIAALQQDYVTAITWMGQACQAAPKSQQFQINYASCLLLNHQEEDAAKLYSKILAHSPRLFESANGYESYGSALEAIGEFRHAIQLFEKGLNINPNNLALLQKLISLRNNLQESKTVLPMLEGLHAVDPSNADLLFSIGVCLVREGNMESAKARFKEALSLNQHHAKALSMLLRNDPDAEWETNLATMREIYDQAGSTIESQITAAFALGRAADRNSQYEQAFTCYAKGNRLRREFVNYDESEQENLHQTASGSFPATRFIDPVSTEANAAAPIFIIGMPRCGSTLLEQALSRHPALKPSGETDAMQQSIAGRKRKVSNPLLIERLASLNNAELLTVGQEYSRRLQQEYLLDGRVIDKTLNNYLYAGAIAKALPQARIIHVRREAMASCLSMFQEDFADAVPYSLEIGELGRQYARYQRLMQHWREVLPEGVMLEVSYEDLVTNPESELRRLLEGCNLEWYEECIATHKATGSVATASLVQVRKPIHQKSVARWKHYEKQLEPIKQHLLA